MALKQNTSTTVIASINPARQCHNNKLKNIPQK
jgi:hypothetical protein